MTAQHLALIIDDVADGYQEPLIAGINHACRELKVALRTYCTSMHFPLNTGECRYGGLMFDLVNESDCIGLIVPIQIYLAIRKQVDIFDVLRKRHDIPLVIIGQANDQFPSIRMDNQLGVVKAMQHLIIDHGYRKIAMVNGPLENQDARDRFTAYQEQLRHFGIAQHKDYICSGTFHYNDGIRAVDQLYKLPLKPQALVAADDYMALGALNRARELNWALHIIGFDNIEASASSEPPLTTIDQDLFRMGQAAAQKLLRRIRKQTDETHTLFAPSLVIRNSCGCREQTVHSDTGPLKTLAKNFDIGELQYYALHLVETLNTEREEIPQALFLVEKLVLEVRRQVTGDLDPNTATKAFIQLLNLHAQASWLENCRKTLQGLLEIYLNLNLTPAQQLFLRLLRFHCSNAINQSLLAEQQMKFDRLQQSKRDIDEFCQAINACFSTFDLVEVLKAHSVVFELGDFAVGVYKSNKLLSKYPRTAPKWSTVIFDRLAQQRDQSYSIATADLVKRRHSERLMVMPLCHKGMELGYMVVSYRREHLRLYSAIAFHLGFALKNIHTIKHSQQDEKKLKATLAQLRGTSAELEHNSVTDELTGLLNRRGFRKASEQHWRYSKQQKDSFIIGYADLDGLKQINDQLGHDQGDLAIWVAGQVLQQCFRRTDIVGRLSGDEFAFILIDSDATNIIAAQSKIQHFCHLANQQGLAFNISISVGFAVFDPSHPLSREVLLSRADAELYDNKVWKKENSLTLEIPSHLTPLK